MQLIRGDCLEVMATLEGDSIDAIVTDPPYGVGYQSSHRKKGERFAPVIGDDAPFVGWMRDGYRTLRPGGVCICFYRWDVQTSFLDTMRACGFDVRSQIVWHKGGGGMGALESSFAPEHELALFATKGAYTLPGDRPMSVVRVPRVPPSSLTHPCEKPVRLTEHLIRVTTRPGAVVLDPFMGSGSTGEACINLGREFIGIELDRDYFARAEERLANAGRQLALTV